MKNFNISPNYKKIFIISVFFITYRVLLDYSYRIVAVTFDYQGLFFDNQTSLSLIYSWLFFLFFLPFCIKVFFNDNLSNLIIILLIIFSLIPMSTVIGFRSDYPGYYLFLIFAYWLLFFIAFFTTRPIVIHSKYNFFGLKFIYFISLLCILTVIFYSFYVTGLRLHFNFINVYEVRTAARSYSTIFPINYILSFSDNALAFFAIFFIYKKRYTYAFIILATIFINFSITATKQILFVPLCGLIGYFFIHVKDYWLRILIAAIILLGLSILELLYFDSLFFTTLFSYRILFIPAELHFSYFSFFQNNEFDFYRQSFLKFFFNSPYEINIQFLLGDFSIGDITARANNGLFSDAYLNLGIIGVFLYPFLIIFLLRLYDGAALRLDSRLWFVVAIYIAFVLLGMTLSTALFTSGLLPFLLMLYAIPHRKT